MELFSRLNRMNGMGRKPRIHFDGAVFHCWARGVDRRVIFVDDADYALFLDCAEPVIRGAGARLIAYCLMPNHFHLLMRVGPVSLSRIMQRILTAYARRFNVRHERTGHLFQERFRQKLVVDNAYLIRLIAYIHRNPVRAQLVDSPGKWRWSSQYRYPIDSVNLTKFDAWEESEPRAVDLFRKIDRPRVPMDAVLFRVAASRGADPELIRTARRSTTGVALRRTAVVAMLEEGYSATEIAAYFRVAVSSITRLSGVRNARTQNLTPNQAGLPAL